MARLSWMSFGKRFYEAGVDRGVIYIDSNAGLPWVGLISVEESVVESAPKAYYVDGDKYLNQPSRGEFEATLTAYTYPTEFGVCDGTAQVRAGLSFGQQARKEFGLSYRTMIGNDIDGAAHGYKIHVVYNALATPSPRSVSTIGSSAEASNFAWVVTTRKNHISGHHPTAHVVIDSRDTHPVTLSAIEDVLYGTDLSVSRLPSLEELITIFDTPLAFSVTDNGNGTYLVGGPDNEVTNIGNGMFTINHESVDIVEDGLFTINY